MAKKALMIASSYGDAFQDAKELGWQINAKAGIQWQGLMENKVHPPVPSMYSGMLDSWRGASLHLTSSINKPCITRAQ
jgi:hypothetical protein